jgi:hypothetical protein
LIDTFLLFFTIFHFITLFPQYIALLSHSSQYHTQISILSYLKFLFQAFTIAPPLSATSQTQSHSKYIFVQKEYLLGAANIPEKTGFPEAHLIHFQFILFSAL